MSDSNRVCLVLNTWFESEELWSWRHVSQLLGLGKTFNKNVTCFAENYVSRFTTHDQTLLEPDSLQDRFDLGGKSRNIAAIQLVF